MPSTKLSQQDSNTSRCSCRCNSTLSAHSSYQTTQQRMDCTSPTQRYCTGQRGRHSQRLTESCRRSSTQRRSLRLTGCKRRGRVDTTCNANKSSHNIQLPVLPHTAARLLCVPFNQMRKSYPNHAALVVGSSPDNRLLQVENILEHNHTESSMTINSHCQCSLANNRTWASFSRHTSTWTWQSRRREECP